MMMTQSMTFHKVDMAYAELKQGDQGSVIEKDGRKLQRLQEKRHRRYVSVFGEHSFEQFVYAIRENQKIELRPVDAQLGLPTGEHSYVLQDWLERFCIKESFEEAGSSLEAVLGLRIPVGTAERMNQHLAEQAAEFRRSQPPPNLEEEGQLSVYANGLNSVLNPCSTCAPFTSMETGATTSNTTSKLSKLRYMAIKRRSGTRVTPISFMR